jgi:hypothetical protein
VSTFWIVLEEKRMRRRTAKKACACFVSERRRRLFEKNGQSISLQKRKTSAPEAARGEFIHPSAFIDERVEIGAGTKIWHTSTFCTVRKSAKTVPSAKMS